MIINVLDLPLKDFNKVIGLVNYQGMTPFHMSYSDCKKTYKYMYFDDATYKLHQINQPAIETIQNDWWWFLGGRYHRIDGPFSSCGSYAVNGMIFHCTEKEEWKKEVDKYLYLRDHPELDGFQ